MNPTLILRLSVPTSSLLLIGLLLSLGACQPVYLDRGDDDDGETSADDDDTAIGDDDDTASDDDDSQGASDDDDTAIGDDDDDDTTGDDDDSQGTFELSQGAWVVIESDLLQDGCGLEDFVDRGQPGSILNLTSTGGENFDMTFEAGEGDTVSCSVDANLDYICATTESTDDTLASLGMSGTILVDIDSSGAFESSIDMSLVTYVDIDCSGDDCGLAELLLGTSFPCTMGMESILDFQAP